jgi:hypothetical protein
MSPSRSIGQKLSELFSRLQPGLLFVALIFGALVAFEIFNYSTTDHALQDLLGGLEFGNMKWSTILALAFCGIDFAGLARLFTPEQGMDEPKEVWYLFGAWLLAATMNAILTWWGVSMAVVNHQVQSTSIIDPKMITTVVPLFVAIMVWVIRILIIGTLSLAMDRLLHPAERRAYRRSSYTNPQPAMSNSQRANTPLPALNPRPTLNRPNTAQEPRYARSSGDNSRYNSQQQEPIARGMPEPTYHSLSMGPNNQNQNANRFQGERPANPTIRRT